MNEIEMSKAFILLGLWLTVIIHWEINLAEIVNNEYRNCLLSDIWR